MVFTPKRDNKTNKNNWTRKQRKRRDQTGGIILGKIAKLAVKFKTKTFLKKGLGVGSKAISSEIEKEKIDEDLKHAPEI